MKWYEMIISRLFKFMNDCRKLEPERTSETIESSQQFTWEKL